MDDKMSSVDWTNLPRELLDVILAKLIHLSDYIRFGAVCKSWHSVAIDQRKSRIATIHKQPPMLLITSPEDLICHQKEFFEFDPEEGSCPWENFELHHQSKLYSISEGKVYHHQFQIPHRDICLGSFYGWLAIKKPDWSIALLNPFTQDTMQFPGIESYLIKKVIASCDPSICPDDLFLAALCPYPPNNTTVALIRLGEKSWTFIHTQNFLNHVNDIIFYQGLLYAVELLGNRLIAFDYRPCNRDNQNAPLMVEIVRQTYMKGLPHLVEASNGDLLLVDKTLKIEHRPFYFGSREKFEVYKLATKKIMSSSSHREEMHWVKIKDLENNDTILLADNHSICISTSCFPNCNRNSIYFTYFSYGWQCNRKFINCRTTNPAGVFQIDSGTISEFHGLKSFEPMPWISPRFT